MKVALIGMPTSGKSTIAKLLVSNISYSLIDLDYLLEKRFQMKLQDFINSEGEDEFLKQENDLMIQIKYPENCIISTGGSVVYATAAMQFLKQSNVHFIYLKVPIEVLEQRLSHQRDKRGVVMNGADTWMDLFIDRDQLYSLYADSVIDTVDKTPQDICNEILKLIKRGAN